jgi:hypothetical protein
MAKPVPFDFDVMTRLQVKPEDLSMVVDNLDIVNVSVDPPETYSPLIVLEASDLTLTSVEAPLWHARHQSRIGPLGLPPAAGVT